MTTDDTPPWEEDEGGISVTFKAGKGYEDPWINVRDKTVGGLKRRIIAAWAFPAEDEALNLPALVNNAAAEFQATRTVTREFPGARAVSGGRRGGQDQAASDDTPAEPAAQAEPELTPLEKIEAITPETKDALKTLKLIWIDHNPLSPEVEAAWRAKGKALKEAGLA